MSEETEIIARALWEDWITNGKTTTEGARGMTWETLVEGGRTRPKIQMIVDDAYSQARAAITAYRAHLSAQGLVIVPSIPTEAMKAAWRGPEPWDEDAMEVWTAMLSAYQPSCN